MPDPRDPQNLRNAENPNSGFVGGGSDNRLEDAGAYQGKHRAEDLGSFQPMPGEMAQTEREEKDGESLKDKYDKAKDVKKKVDEFKNKKGGEPESGAPEGAGGTPGAGTPGAGTPGTGAPGTGTGAAGQGAVTPGAGGAATPGAAAPGAMAPGAVAPGAAAGEGAAVAGEGALGAGAAGASAGAAGAGAGGAGAGVAAGAGAGTGALASGASAGVTGGASLAAGATAGAGAGAGAAAGAGVGAGAAVATTTGAETGGIGALVGLAIVVGTLAATFAWKHRKGLIGLGFVTIVGFLLLGVAFLNALKPIASTVQTAQKYLGPVASIVEERSMSILGRFATSGSAVAMAQAKETVGKTDSSGNGHVLAATTDGAVTEGKLATLFEAMRKDKFEDRLKQNYGLEFTGAGNAGINIVWRGTTLGTAKNATEARGILEAFFPDLQRLLDEEMQSWSWAQHVQVARNLKRYFTIPGLYVPGGETAYAPQDLIDIIKYKTSTILRPGLTNMARALECFTTGSGCNDDNQPVDATAEPALQNNDESGISQATQAAYDENIKNITPDNDYDTPRLDEAANANVKAGLSKKAIGILGWLDVTASMTHLALLDNAQQLPVLLRQKQAGALWTWNLSAVNQMIPGDMSPTASSLITRNYQNIEDSQAFNYVAYDDNTRGVSMGEELKVNSVLAQPFKYELQLIQANPIFRLGLTAALETWLLLRQHTPIGIIITVASHFPLVDLVNRFLGAVLQKIGITDFIEKTLGVSSSQTLPICDQADKTYNFFNCMATGAKAAANQAVVYQFGGTQITNTQQNELLSYDAKRQQASLAWRPLQDRLFDKALPNSFINVAAMQSPVPIKATQNVASFVQGIFAAVWKAPENIAAISAKPAHAATANSSDIDGQKHMGIPLDVLRKTNTIPPQMTDGDPCPDIPYGQLNTCLSYAATIDALTARYTYNPGYTGN
jgi:hypothetical protein